jgi:hypothetical protein
MEGYQGWALHCLENRWIGDEPVGVRFYHPSSIFRLRSANFIHLTFNQNRKKATCFIVGALCNGSTTDFDSVSLGSIPNAPASLWDRRWFRVPPNLA